MDWAEHFSWSELIEWKELADRRHPGAVRLSDLLDPASVEPVRRTVVLGSLRAIGFFDELEVRREDAGIVS